MSRRKLGKDKKGSLQDMLLVAIVIFALAVIILVGYKITSEVNTELQASDIVDARGKAASSTLTGHYTGVIDNSFLFFVIGINLVVLILAALVRIHPIFIFLFLIGLVVVIFATGILSNIYQEMAANSNLSTEADQLTFTTLTMEYLPFIIGIFGFILMAVQYKLWRLDAGG